MKRAITILLALALITAAQAQSVRQLHATGGSVVGTAGSVRVRTVGVAGEPIAGLASGNVGAGAGFGAVYPLAASEPSGTETVPLPPSEFRFEQNYPNPFNPTTVFEFQLPHEERVRLVIYDILGREAAVVADGLFTAGVHRLFFQAPPQLASGLYIARFQAGGFSKIRKLALIK